jgi:hypothetical protein
VKEIMEIGKDWDEDKKRMVYPLLLLIIMDGAFQGTKIKEEIREDSL